MHDTVSAEQRRELGRMLRAWRLAKVPEQIPGYAALPPRSRQSDTVTQQDVALLAGISVRYYGALEQGKEGSYSREAVDGVVRALMLNEDQMTALYAGTGHEPPRRSPQHQTLNTAVTRILDALPWGAYVSDRAWDVLAVNDLARIHFPFLDLPGANVMQWSLSAGASWQLTDWENSWARPMLAQLRAATFLHPTDQRLAEVAKAVRRYQPINRLWKEDPSAQVHPDGNIRPMWIPTYTKEKPVDMEVVAYNPMRDPGLRLIVMMPVDEELAQKHITR